ncbi:MAG: phosphate ABC transporter ATP-binding protein [Candidatus Margulisbacteria bacterium]|nr:phosphate ABC transporter ATP-binding protein [Candidatus Margulisiibacteriota bacterium]
MVAKLRIDNLCVFYGSFEALKGINLEVQENEILGIIGPANSGKTTFLKSINRMLDFTPNVRIEGKIYFDTLDAQKEIKRLALRRRIGMVYALPLPLPLSIFDNVAYGPRLHGTKKKKQLDEIVERCLKASYLWDEVKDRLKTPAFNLSGGQQQRLCISRTLAVEPEVILYDEPCSGLDPISTAKVEEAMRELKQKYTQILVTNNTKQAARVSDRTAFFLMGELIELDITAKMFTAPSDKRTDDYIAGRFG